MMQRVLPDAQVAAQAGKAKKVDQNPLPPPGQVSPSLPGGEDVCDGLLVTDGQVVSVFLLSHIIPRRFFAQLLPLPFLS